MGGVCALFSEGELGPQLTQSRLDEKFVDGQMPSLRPTRVIFSACHKNIFVVIGAQHMPHGIGYYYTKDMQVSSMSTKS